MGAPSVTLRQICRDDEPFLFHVYASTRLDELAPLDWSEDAKTAFLQQQFAAQHQHYHTYFAHADFKIILLDDRPIGRLYVARQQDEIRLVDIALLPEYRNAGIGTRLLQDLLAEAAAAVKPVHLHVEKFNPALRLYERLGFSRIADRGVYWFMEWLPSSQRERRGA